MILDVVQNIHVRLPSLKLTHLLEKIGYILKYSENFVKTSKIAISLRLSWQILLGLPIQIVKV